MAARGEYGAALFGRWVGISVFAFCTDCGQPRKLLRSSSGAKSRGESHPPASRPITSSPAWASGRAATPPTAPSPTITTSVFLRFVAIAASFLREHLEVVRRPAIGRRLHAHALVVLGDRQTNPRVADQVPANEVCVTTIVRIAEHALDRMRPDQVEEGGRGWRKALGDVFLHIAQHGVLVLRRQFGEGRAFGGLRIGVDRGETRSVRPT